MRWIISAITLLAWTAGCGDPYARYATAVQDDVDPAMAAAFRMAARVQLTVVHDQIPADSMGTVADVVRRTEHTVHARAIHFSAVTPPPELTDAHAQLALALSNLDHALDAMAAAFERHSTTLPSFGDVGGDIRMARYRVQRLLLPHGILLNPINFQ